MKEYDVRDLACPGPVLKLRELLENGERQVRFHVADELCRSNVTRFANSRKAGVDVKPAEDGTFFVTVTAGTESQQAIPGEGEALAGGVTQAVARGPVVVQISGSTMGTGDDELGALLLRSFLKTQAQLERTPDAIIFYNKGVKLCCEGSALLEDLHALEDSGIQIIASGTCLDFFGITHQLAVGRVTDMLEIAGRLADAGSILRP